MPSFLARLPPRAAEGIRGASIGVGLVLGLLVAPVAWDEARAESTAGRITRANVAQRQVGGPDADAGIGDWFLSNGTICAALSDPSHESGPSSQGGVLIDLGHCGASNDQWTVLQPMLNLSQSEVVRFTDIESGAAVGSAWIRTRARFHSIELLTTYSVNDSEPTVLSMETRARRVAEGDALFSIGSILLHPSGQTPVFSLYRAHPERSLGFQYPSSDRRSLFSLANALVSSDLSILVGGDALSPISYGLERVHATLSPLGATASGPGRGTANAAPSEATAQDPPSPQPLASFSVSGGHFTFLNTLSNPTWIGGAAETPGLLQLLQLPFMDVGPETELSLAFRIHVGARADVASITDQIWPDAAPVQGSIDDPEARIHIDLRSGAPFSEIRPDPDGRYALRLPPGAYRARALGSAGRETTLEFEVAPDATQVRVPPITLGSPGWVAMPPGFIGRLTFVNEDGSGPALFGDDLLGFRVGEKAIPSGLEAPWLNLAASPLDPARVPLSPGRYRVIAVRGPEYEARVETIEVQAGAVTPLSLTPLARIAPTEGWLAADLHVHSAQSFDSSLPQSIQAVAFAASGAELLVASEHNRVIDPRPAIDRARLGEQLISITGVEVTSSFEGGESPYGTGHMNAFPFSPVAGAYRQGAPPIEGRRLRDVLAGIRRAEPGAFIQMNHPRPKPDESEGDTYFAHLGVAGEPFDPTRPLTAMPNAVLIEKGPSHAGRDLDYHGVELMNGPNLFRFRRTRADWLSLLLQGEYAIATANSDSHRLGVVVGLPRTYVQLESDQLEDFDEAAFIAALRAGRAYGSTGPQLTLHLDEAGIGGVHSGDKGTLTIRVDAADWVPVREWRAYVNGELVHSAPIHAGETAHLPLVFVRDGFVTVEVEGPAEGLYREVLPEFTPFAFTNPIFVDFDGNGRYDAPGLPDTLPAALVGPEFAD